MKIAQFIRTHPDEIEAQWEKFAKSISSFAPDLSASSLRDHLREILLAIADDMESIQSEEQRLEKSEGNKKRGGALDRISAVHARMRLNSGFSLEHAISEYRSLRSSILFLWVHSQPADDDVVLSEVTRFNEAVDQAIAEVIRRFAEKSERYSDVFLGVLTHEVRNPLNAITLSGEALKVGPLQEIQARGVERILKGAGSINRLVNDLSVLVRSRMRVPFPLMRASVDLGEICEQTLEEVKASFPDAVLELKKIGDLVGEWDRERLEQVIYNLAANAIIHDSANHVLITIEAQGPEVVFRVTNEGAAIPPDLQDSIFDPFVRTDTPQPFSAHGLGLGLFIVKEIVMGHGGTVELASTEDEGTTFTVRLPRVPPPPRTFS
jgi:signal transduction histidine kinase